MRKHHLKKQLKRLGLLAYALVFLFFLNTNVTGQEGAGNIAFGVKVGVASSTLSNSYQNMLYSENKVGFAGGGFVSYQILDFLGASAEVLYVQEGASHTNPSFFYYPEALWRGETAKENTNLTMHNIEIPVMLNLYIPGFTGDIEPRFYVGGSFDIITKSIAKDQIYISASDGFLPEREIEDVSESIEWNNIGLIIGTGFNFNGGDIGMTLDVRYKIGMNNISNLATLNHVGYYGYTDAFSTNCLMVLVGISLP